MQKKGHYAIQGQRFWYLLYNFLLAINTNLPAIFY